MALVGTGAALHAGIEEYTKTPVFTQQVAHLLNGLLLPVFHQLTGEAQGFLDRRLGDKGRAMGHGIPFDFRDYRNFF